MAVTRSCAPHLSLRGRESAGISWGCGTQSRQPAQLWSHECEVMVWVSRGPAVCPDCEGESDAKVKVTLAAGEALGQPEGGRPGASAEPGLSLRRMMPMPGQGAWKIPQRSPQGVCQKQKARTKLQTAMELGGEGCSLHIVPASPSCGLNSGEAPPDSFPRGSKVGRGGTAQLGPSFHLPGLGGGPGGCQSPGCGSGCATEWPDTLAHLLTSMDLSTLSCNGGLTTVLSPRGSRWGSEVRSVVH